MVGKVSSRWMSTGTDTLYGRFATMAVGSAGEVVPVAAAAFATVAAGRSVTTSASAWITVSMPWATPWVAAVVGNSAASRGSISIAVTGCPCSSNPRVSEPSPGPTSTTDSPSCSLAAVTILRTVFASCTKFCPHFFVGDTSSRSARARISVAPRSVTTCRRPFRCCERRRCPAHRPTPRGVPP